MTFIYPLGLIGLIGVPIVILIYILRSKYTEQTVPSTYLWLLSERFFKRRNPFSGLTGIISLILQILTVVFVSLAIARPVFIIPESAENYCFVLDCSGSMNIDSDGKSRFELAKEKIAEMIDSSVDGSTYTLVTAGSEANVVYEKADDKAIAKELLFELECTDGEIDYSNALSTAQSYFSANRSTSVILATDKSFAKCENVEIVNVGLQNVRNYAISDVEGELTDGVLSAKANVYSFLDAGTVEVAFYVDGSDSPTAVKQVEVSPDAPSAVQFTYASDSFSSFRLVVKNSDALASDNEVIYYNKESEEEITVLVVSETPFFFEAVLDVNTDAKVDTVLPEDYKDGTDYGMYIFHSFTPDTLPDGAVWLVNCTRSVDDAGFGIRGVIGLDAPDRIEKSNSTSSIARKLLSGIEGRDIYISEYVKYSGMYTKFTTLFSYGSNPLIFAGTNALGNRQVVFGFDLHTSDIALSPDFAPLMQNLLEFSCPDVVERTDYVCGDTVNINITANAKNLKATSPDGDNIYIDTGSDVCTLSLDKVGTYTVSMTVANVEQRYKIFSSAPIAESDPDSTGEDFSLVGVREYEKADGKYDPVAILFICLAVIFTADWMVYCYEKYQLR